MHENKLTKSHKYASIIDGKSIVDQVQDLLLLVTKLCEVKEIILDALQVGAIMSKLPHGWNKDAFAYGRRYKSPRSLKGDPK